MFSFKGFRPGVCVALYSWLELPLCHVLAQASWQQNFSALPPKFERVPGLIVE